jgi:hypothetical protein
MRAWSAPQASMEQRRRGLAAGLKRISPVLNPGEDGRSAAVRGEWGSPSTTLCDAPWHWEMAAHIPELDTHPAFIVSHRVPRPSESGPVHGLPSGE